MRLLRRINDSFAVSRAFVAWADYSHTKLALAIPLQRAVRKMMHANTAAAFSGWQGWLSVQKRQRVVIASIISRMRSMAVSKAFDAWASHAHEQIVAQAAAKVSDVALRRAVRKKMHAFIAAAFATWSCHVCPMWRFVRTEELFGRCLRTV